MSVFILGKRAFTINIFTTLRIENKIRNQNMIVKLNETNFAHEHT